MIWHPKVGQNVKLIYNKKRAALFPYNGTCGEVEAVGSGKIVNVLVRIGDKLAVVPRGNLTPQGVK
jgi:hypothetical protein